jgi:hypothetical protein
VRRGDHHCSLHLSLRARDNARSLYFWGNRRYLSCCSRLSRMFGGSVRESGRESNSSTSNATSSTSSGRQGQREGRSRTNFFKKLIPGWKPRSQGWEEQLQSLPDGMREQVRLSHVPHSQRAYTLSVARQELICCWAESFLLSVIKPTHQQVSWYLSFMFTHNVNLCLRGVIAPLLRPNAVAWVTGFQLLTETNDVGILQRRAT